MSLIDVIIGVKDEEKHIEKCIRSLQKQKIEDINIIVIDGLSKDGTRTIVQRLMEKDERIRLLVNEKQIISSARNIGLESSTADFVAYLDGHTFVGNDWLDILYTTFKDCEGKVLLAGIGSTYASPDNDSLFGKTAAYCLKTFFGGFGTSYTEEKIIHKVDTVAFALYRRSLLEKERIIYDENMTHCEDTDFNHQIINKGYVLLKHPKALVYQYRRKNLNQFFRQMVNYGNGRAKLVIKYKETLKPEHLIPVLIVFYLLFSIFSLPMFITKLISSYTLTLILTPVFLYIIIDLCYTISIMVKYQSLKHIYALFIFPAEHVGYGVGFLKGLIKGLN